MAERVLGADVSHWQFDINWSKMADSGLNYVFIKATDGTHGVDDRFASNWKGAKAAGLLRGAYHFFRSDLNPAQQAKHFFEELVSQGGTGELPPVLDVENRPLQAAGVKSCLDEIQRLFGKKPLVYSAPGIWNEMGTLSWAKEYDLWVAQYPYRGWSDGVLAGVAGKQPRLPKGWDRWLFWQFSDKAPGKTYGVESKTLDLNHFNGSVAALRTYAGAGDREVTPSPVTKDIAERYIDALNTRRPDELIKLYHPSSVHVNESRTIQGPDAIRAWYAKFFIQQLPNGVFTLTGYSGFGGSRHITWKATSSRGRVLNGNDTFGLIDGKIAYHFTSFTMG